MMPISIALPIHKVAIQTDGTFGKLLAGLAQNPDTTLSRMKNLKFRQLGLSATSMYTFIARCPNLTRLDASFTPLHRLPPPTVTLSTLEKLSLTSTGISSMDAVSLISALPNLRTLYLGALGSGQSSSSSISNISAMMADDTLRSLTDVISHFERLENLSLVGNSVLGLGTPRHDINGALADVIRRVGRKCKACRAVPWTQRDPLIDGFFTSTSTSPDYRIYGHTTCAGWQKQFLMAHAK